MNDDDRIRAICLAHSNRVKRPYGRCREVSERLAADLLRKGMKANVLRCSQGRFDAPDADPRWHRLRRAPDCWVHYVVQTGERYHDLTRRQFFPDDRHPYEGHISELARDWGSVEVVDAN